MSKQLALFGEYQLAELPTGINVRQSYRKAGDKWKGAVDKQGFCLVNGNRIETTCRINLLPLKSEDGPSLEKVTGKKGQELKFEAEAMRHQLMGQSFAQFSQMATSGKFTFKDMSVNKATGVVSLSLKPTNVVVIKQDLTKEELLAQAEKLGMQLVPVSK